MSVHDDLASDKFFTGIEVENTPTFKELTLFIVGTPDIKEVEEALNEFHKTNATWKEDTIKCLYFGANHSFKLNPDQTEWDQWQPWDRTIKHFLNLGYWCTLDIDLQYVEGLLEGGLTEYNNFVPMISAKVPYIQQLGYNAILKIDDKGFAKTNPGVWCHRVHDLMNHDVFTYWDEYSEDTAV